MSDGTRVENKDELEELIRAGISLQRLDASGVDLTGLDLSEQDFTGANLRYADLSKADMRNSILVDANLRHARLLQTDLRFVDMTRADISKADLHGAIFGETRMVAVSADDVAGVKTEVFLPMDLLEKLLEQSGVNLGEEELQIPGDGIENYRTVAGFRIVAPEAGDKEDRKLLGKVLSTKQIKDMGGEVAGSSVIVGDVVYRCEEGYIAIPAKGKVKAAAQPVEKDEEEGSDMDLLKDFLLTKLE